MTLGNSGKHNETKVIYNEPKSQRKAVLIYQWISSLSSYILFLKKQIGIV